MDGDDDRADADVSGLGDDHIDADDVGDMILLVNMLMMTMLAKMNYDVSVFGGGHVDGGDAGGGDVGDVGEDDVGSAD